MLKSRQKIISAIRERCPAPNRNLIIDHPRREINGIRQTLAKVFSQSCKFLEGDILKFTGMTPMSPEERVQEVRTQLSRGAGAAIKKTEVEPVNYHFTYDGTPISMTVWLPYIGENTFMTVDGVNYAPFQVLAEKIFSRNGEVITIRVPRLPLQFERTYPDKNSMHTSICGRYTLTTLIPVAKLHSKTSSKIFRPTIGHYLMAEFGFFGACAKLGVDPKAFRFTNELPEDFETGEWLWFEGNKRLKKKVDQEDPIFIGAKLEDLNDFNTRRFFHNVVYIFSKFTDHRIDDILDPEAIRIKQYLGSIYYTGRVKEPAMILNQAEDHLYSIAQFIDPDTQARYARFGFEIKDIWHLLVWMFQNMDGIYINKKTQDLYDKRIAVLEQAIIDTYIKAFNSCIYRFSQDRSKLSETLIRRKLKIPPMAYRRVVQSASVTQPETVNANALLTWGLDALRLGNTRRDHNPNSRKLRFHPSWAVVYSLVGYSGAIQGYKGQINPFLQIDQDGGIIRPDYASEIDDLIDYLPFK